MSGDHRHPLDCEEVMARLFAFLDGELDAATQEDVEAHLRACRDCFSRADFERRLKARVAEVGAVQAPERLRERVRTMIARF